MSKHNLKIGDIVQFYGYCGKGQKGKVVTIKNNRVGVLKASTTTGALTICSLRNNNNFVPVGWSMDEQSHCEYFRNEK